MGRRGLAAQFVHPVGSMRTLPLRLSVPKVDRGRRVAAALGLALAFGLAPAQACPNCDPGREARADVWSDGFFLRNLATAVLPFVVIGAVCASVQKIGRRP